MAYFEDTFTGVNGTVLNVHDANYSLVSTGNIANATIQSNRLEYNSFTKAVARHSLESGNDDSSILLVGGTYQLRTGVGVRSSASSEGYVALYEIGSSPNYTRLALYKNGSRIAFNGSVNEDSANDITLRITATDNGSDVDLEIFVNDVSSLTHTDLSASTPLPSGNPCIYFGNTAGGFSKVDDFTSGAAPSGPTITGPDTVTEGSATAVTGTGFDSVVSFALQTSSLLYGLVQTTWSNSDDSNGSFTPNSGYDDASAGSPSAGLPMTPTITAAGVTVEQVQTAAFDGASTGARDVDFDPPATHEVIQGMIATSNVTDGESIWASSIFTGGMQDNAQARVPKQVDGVNLTWSADGTVVADTDQTITFPMGLFSPANGEWGVVSVTVTESSIDPVIGGTIGTGIGIGIGIGI